MPDPVIVLPPEVVRLVFQYLDFASLAQSEQVCRRWRQAIHEYGCWRDACVSLWKDKFYVAPEIRSMLDAGHAKEALRASIEDSRRTFMTEKEVMSWVWCARYKAWAGPEWVLNDPWWNGEDPYKLVFLPGGVAKCNAYEVPFQWRFVERGPGPEGPRGSYFQVNRFPPMRVFRHPVHWGFMTENCWALYTSFPMPPHGGDPLLDDENLPLNADTQREDIIRYQAAVEEEVANQPQDDRNPDIDEVVAHMDVGQERLRLPSN